MDLAIGCLIGFACGCVVWLLILGKSLAGLSKAAELIDEESALAYLDGVEDGFGFAREPWSEEYQNAGAYLKANLGHRFPEFTEEET